MQAAYLEQVPEHSENPILQVLLVITIIIGGVIYAF